MLLQPPILLLGMASAIGSRLPFHPTASTLKRRGRGGEAIQFQKIWRQMEEPGAPPQTMTRYLYNEFAEFRSVSRLAEGFDVHTNVVPMVEQKLKQDPKVLKTVPLALSML